MGIVSFFIGLGFICAAFYLASWPRAPRSVKQ